VLLIKKTISLFDQLHKFVWVLQLKQERDRVERQLSGLNAALKAFAGVYGGPETMTHEKEDYASPRVYRVIAYLVSATASQSSTVLIAASVPFCF
jgi:hypothetical protein